MPLNSGVGEDFKDLRVILDCKEIKPVHPKGNKSWIFIGRTDAEAETPVLWPPDAKDWYTGKDADGSFPILLGKIEGQRRRDEMVEWHHWLKGCEFEQGLGDGDGQGGLACCSPWGCKESDMTERLNWTSQQQTREASKQGWVITSSLLRSVAEHMVAHAPSLGKPIPPPCKVSSCSLEPRAACGHRDLSPLRTPSLICVWSMLSGSEGWQTSSKARTCWARFPLEDGLPWWINVKESSCQWFDPWVRKRPWRKWQPTPVSLPGKFHGQRKPGRLQSTGSQRIGHDWATELDWRNSSEIKGKWCYLNISWTSGGASLSLFHPVLLG